MKIETNKLPDKLYSAEISDIRLGEHFFVSENFGMSEYIMNGTPQKVEYYLVIPVIDVKTGLDYELKFNPNVPGNLFKSSLSGGWKMMK